MRCLCTSIVVTLVLGGTASSQPISKATPPPSLDEVHAHDHGEVVDTHQPPLTNCVVPTESLRFSTIPIPRGAANVETIHNSGDPANRLDLVFVGDGYTAAEIPSYVNMVQDRTDFLLNYNPFDQYQNWINIHRVDVISTESGIDNDLANENIEVDTAMDMTFTEPTTGGPRLVMDWAMGHSYANLAPDVDCIAAAGNTISYGGVATGIDICTFSGSHSLSDGLLMHELGHALMHLADEYFNEGQTFTGGERAERNVSILNATDMSSAETKWSHWLGHSIQGVGTHNTFEGGYYHEFGVHRPTADSVMNWLENPLNGPGIEATILQLHLAVDPIDSISHPDLIVDEDVTLSANVLHPNGHQLGITWTVNGDVAATGSSTLDLGSIALPAGANLVELTVVDPNPLVRDERLRADFLTSRRAWIVHTDTAPSGACCLGESCFVTSKAECAANTGYWVEGEDCNGAGCYWFNSCMQIDSYPAAINTNLPPDLDIVGVSIRRLPRNLIEARIELAGPPLPPDDPGIGNRLYRIFVDTDAPFMTGVDWDDVDQEWGVKPIGGSYRGAAFGVLDEVVIDGNTIIMWVDPSVLSNATEIAFFAEAASWESSIFDQGLIGQGRVPRWEDLDDDGIPDHCDTPGTTHDVCPVGCTYTTIQQAIDVASNGDEILVGPGTYTSTSDNVVNTLGKNVLLHSSHGPDQTFIDGQGARRGILADSGETSLMVIEGFTIQNCQAGEGGAIRCVWDSQPTFRNCIIRNNQANFGGGMWNEEDTTLIDCIFEGNTATENGGGIDNPWGGSPTLIRCSFISNTAGSNGGGIQNYQAGTSVFTECSFIDNIANYGGGVNHNNSTNTILLNCTFDGNEAELGGGIYAEGGTLDVEACSFTNHAGGAGGGLYSDGTSVTVTSSDFSANSVYWDGGGIDTNWGSLVVNDCRFENNDANFLGGSISVYGTATQITGCRVGENQAGESGGGLYFSKTVGQVEDTLFCANLPDHVTGEFTGSGIEFLNTCPADCPEDINGDGFVDLADFSDFLVNFGATGENPADINGDLVVDLADFSAFLVAYGNACEDNRSQREVSPQRRQRASSRP